MKRLNLQDFKLQKSGTLNEEKIENLMGSVLGQCHDGWGQPMTNNIENGHIVSQTPDPFTNN